MLSWLFPHGPLRYFRQFCCGHFLRQIRMSPFPHTLFGLVCPKTRPFLSSWGFHCGPGGFSICWRVTLLLHPQPSTLVMATPLLYCTALLACVARPPLPRDYVGRPPPSTSNSNPAPLNLRQCLCVSHQAVSEDPSVAQAPIDAKHVGEDCQRNWAIPLALLSPDRPPLAMDDTTSRTHQSYVADLSCHEVASSSTT